VGVKWTLQQQNAYLICANFKIFVGFGIMHTVLKAVRAHAKDSRRHWHKSTRVDFTTPLQASILRAQQTIYDRVIGDALRGIFAGREIQICELTNAPVFARTSRRFTIGREFQMACKNVYYSSNMRQKYARERSGHRFAHVFCSVKQISCDFIINRFAVIRCL
jgi:hypothetical protein